MSVVKHTFEFESQSFQLRKTCGYELWVGDKVLVHFGGNSLHCIQEWCNLEDVKLEK